jgi:glycine betaine/choline ABC-type transport system substrate-binding protein
MLRRAAAPLVLVLLLAACGGGGDEPTESSKPLQPDPALAKLIRENPANASTTLTIASKNFTEEYILGEIYAQALKAGGYGVRKRLDYGAELVAFNGVKAGKIDAYP